VKYCLFFLFFLVGYTQDPYPWPYYQRILPQDSKDLLNQLDQILHTVQHSGRKLEVKYWYILLGRRTWKLKPPEHKHLNQQIHNIRSRKSIHSIMPRFHVYEMNANDEPQWQRELSFEGLLQWIASEFSKGYPVLPWVYHSVMTERDFARVLDATRDNACHTSIRLLFCKTTPCIKSQEVYRFLKTQPIPPDDGSHLRLQAEFVSRELNKVKFFSEMFSPFAGPEPR